MKNENKKSIPQRRKAHIFSMLTVFSFLLVILAVSVGAESLADSAVVNGVNNLVADITGVLLILCPSVGGLLAIYYLIRRAMSDEHDGKLWIRKIYWAIGCGVGGGLVAGIISLISSYF